MRITLSVVVVLSLLCQIPNIHAQTPTDRFVGFWSVKAKSEEDLFIITKENGKYKILVMSVTDTDPVETWTASLVNGSLSGINGSVLKLLSTRQLNISNYLIEGSDEATLHKLDKLSTFFGIWKRPGSNVNQLRIGLTTNASISCSRTSNLYSIRLSKNKPNAPPFNLEDACGTNESIISKNISIKYVSDGKAIVTWQEENIYNEPYFRSYPIPTTISAKYGDLGTFWNDFKGAAISKDYPKILRLTYFPFLNHGHYEDKVDFANFTFSADIIQRIKTAKLPEKAYWPVGEAFDTHGRLIRSTLDKDSIYRVWLGGVEMYFAKVDGEFRFVYISYGE